MPIEVTYPGVYVEEIASGQHAIPPVSTSVAAFVGRAPVGPTDVPVTVFSFGEYTRIFGGLRFDYPLSYSVQDFFANGGSQAVVARLFEPAEGDGVALLKFPGPPPIVPEGWTVAEIAEAGAATLTVAPPTGGSEGDPDVGMALTIGGDLTRRYIVTAYATADPSKKRPATITVAPPIPVRLRKCTALAFAQGEPPQGWSATVIAGSSVTFAGGTGLPDLGDTFVFAADKSGASYVAISEPVVTGNDPATLRFTVTLDPKPGTGVGGAATIAPPVPLPMPADWQIDDVKPGASASSAILTLVNGTGAARIGDVVTIGTAKDVYVVTAFTAATDKAPTTTMTVRSESGQAIDLAAFCHCCEPVFRRDAPADVSIKTGAKLADTQFMPAAGGAMTGTFDVGDTFQIDGDPAVYSVRYIDAGGAIHFLPPAQQAFGPSSDISFSPPLMLQAASPGEWGNHLTAKADQQGISDKTALQFREFGLTKADLFNLSLTQRDPRGQIVATERFLNLSVKSTDAAASFPNRVDRVLKDQSDLARVGEVDGVPRLPAIPPAPGAITVGLGGNDGTYLEPMTYVGDQSSRTGLYMLEPPTDFNLLCIPPDRRILPGVPDAEQDLDPYVNQAAATYCADRRAFYVVDPPASWKNKAKQNQLSQITPEDLGISGMNTAGVEVARNAAVYFPRICREDPLMKSQLALFAPSGAVAGVMAATDVARGVWKAPAGVDAGLAGVRDLEVHLTDQQNGQLNPLGVNCLRQFPIVGPIVWGARTLRGADQFEDDYKYVPVRRLTLFIEESLRRGTQWAVFEPNDEALWSSLRLAANGFLSQLARQGAFYDYGVACDAHTTNADDIAAGVVNLRIRIAPVKPAEFVMLQIQQLAGPAPN